MEIEIEKEEMENENEEKKTGKLTENNFEEDSKIGAERKDKRQKC